MTHRGRTKLVVLSMTALCLFGAVWFGQRSPAAGTSWPTLRMVTAGPFHFVTDHSFDRQAGPVSADLQDLGRQLQADLGIAPPTVPVRVYIFQDAGQYQRFLAAYLPDLTRWDTQRNGLFLLRNGVPHIFALRTDGLRESLRHEYVHVLLNLAYPGLPIWLDEGLAVFHEATDGTGWQPKHLTFLTGELRRGWQPDLHRLQRLKQMQEMGRREYAEAWSWVYLLLAGQVEGRELLKTYLVQLRTAPNCPGLAERLDRSRPDPRLDWMALYHVPPERIKGLHGQRY